MKLLFLRRPHRVIAAMAMTVGLTGGAIAADVALPAKAPLAPAPAIETWSFSLTPYLWATSLTGHTTVKGVTTNIDASFFDILDHTEFPKNLFQIAAFGEARYGRFGVLADLAYMKVGVSGDQAKTRGVDQLNGTIGLSAGITTEMVIAKLAAAYEITRWGASTAPSWAALDLYAGGRAWWQRGETQVQVFGTLNVFNFTRTADGTLSATGNVNWFDPLVGARLRYQFFRGLDLAVSGDIGGFDVGSKFSWQALAILNYEFYKTPSTSWNAMIGYNALSVNYSQGSGLSLYEYDITMHGPIFGVTARF